MTPRLTRLGAAVTLVLMLVACTASSGRPSGLPGKGSTADISPLPPPRKLLGVSAQISYDADQAIALAKKVSSGRGYRDIVGNMMYPALLRRFSGAAIGDLHLAVVFTGEVKQSVRVTNIDITSVRASRKSLSGTYLPVAHQGGQDAYEFTSDMNQAYPRIVRTKNGQTFPDFNIKLSMGEQSTVSVGFTASSGTFRWFLTITYLVGQRKYRSLVRSADNGSLTVTGPAQNYSAVYESDGYTGVHLRQNS